MPHAPHAITSLTLENFRNYRTLALTLPQQPVVLRGHNGAGKTNILEAISLLAPGRGLRGARLREMDKRVVRCQVSGVSKEVVFTEQSQHATSVGLLTTDDWRLTTPSPWVVAAQVVTGDATSFIGTGRDGESAADTRIIKINGERVRGHAALASQLCVQWLTPAMDQVFVEGGSARRKLLDRIVYGFAPEHAARVAAYETAMRERNRLLVDRALTDPYWLSVIEQQMAEHAVAITLARMEALGRVQASLAAEEGAFPRAILALTGTLETGLAAGQSALEVEAAFAAILRDRRAVDASSGRTGDGAHRSQLAVTHREKNMPAEQCSTGEQKALLLSIILAAARARAAWCGMAPILLLDEVIAHLDADKRRALFDLIRATAIQAWMTGTDAADFKGLEGFASVLEVADGVVST